MFVDRSQAFAGDGLRTLSADEDGATPINENDSRHGLLRDWIPQRKSGWSINLSLFLEPNIDEGELFCCFKLCHATHGCADILTGSEVVRLNEEVLESFVGECYDLGCVGDNRETS